MKITRRQLRDIILEGVTASAEGTTGARRVNAGTQLEAQNKAREIVVAAIEKLNHGSNLKGTVKLGRGTISVDLDEVGSKEIRGLEKQIKDVVKATLDEMDADGSFQESLKAFRRVKVDFAWEPETEDQAGEGQTSPGGSGGSGSGDDDGAGGDDTREDPTGYTDSYTLKSDGSIQYKSPRSGKIITVTPESNKKAYDSIMRKVFPDKAAGSSDGGDEQQGPSTPKTLSELINVAVDERMVAETTSFRVPGLETTTGVSVAFVANNAREIAAFFGSEIRDAIDGAGYVIVRKEKAGVQHPVDNKTLVGAIFQVTESGVNGFYVDINGKRIGTINDIRFTTADYSQLARNEDGDIIDSGSPKAVAGIDAQIVSDIVAKLKSLATGAEGMSETVYGESRGTLLRKRYYGRY